MFVPDLDTALTIAPEVPPYSASNWLVNTLNSCTASIGTRACELVPPPVKPSLLSDPSIV